MAAPKKTETPKGARTFRVTCEKGILCFAASSLDDAKALARKLPEKYGAVVEVRSEH